MSFCFAIDINLVDGDSSYNRRHNLPVSNQNDKDFTFDKITRTDLMVGYHEQPGGLWSRDYTFRLWSRDCILAEFKALRTNPNLPPSSCRLHWTSEMIGYDPKVLYSPPS